MMNDVRRRVQGVAEEIRAVIAGIGIELEHVRESVKRGGGKPILINVRKRAHRAAIADAEKIEIIGMLAIFGKQWNRVDARAVMVKLPLETLDFRGIDEIPVAAGTAVIAPTRNRGIVTKDGIKRHFGFVFVTEMLHPAIDLLLARGIPRHFAAERIGFDFPFIGAGTHAGLEVFGLLRHALAAQILEHLEKNVSFHLAEMREARREIRHGDGGLVGMLEVPLPGMIGDEILMIPREAVKSPISRDDVRIIIRAVNRFGRFFVPACPTAPVQVAAIIVRRQLIRLIVEEALANAELFRTVLVLDAAPQNTVYELLVFVDLLLIGLAKFLHGCGEP